MFVSHIIISLIFLLVLNKYKYDSSINMSYYYYHQSNFTCFWLVKKLLLGMLNYISKLHQSIFLFSCTVFYFKNKLQAVKGNQMLHSFLPFNRKQNKPIRIAVSILTIQSMYLIHLCVCKEATCQQWHVSPLNDLQKYTKFLKW